MKKTTLSILVLFLAVSIFDVLSPAYANKIIDGKYAEEYPSEEHFNLKGRKYVFHTSDRTEDDRSIEDAFGYNSELVFVNKGVFQVKSLKNRYFCLITPTFEKRFTSTSGYYKCKRSGWQRLKDNFL